jgi:hypothetical protein
MSEETAELTEDNLIRAQEFARYLLLHAGPLIDEMQLTRTEAELGFTYLLAESLSHRSKGIRKILTLQWQELVDSGADNFEAERIQKRSQGRG